MYFLATSNIYILYVRHRNVYRYSCTCDCLFTQTHSAHTHTHTTHTTLLTTSPYCRHPHLSCHRMLRGRSVCLMASTVNYRRKRTHCVGRTVSYAVRRSDSISNTLYTVSHALMWLVLVEYLTLCVLGVTGQCACTLQANVKPTH